MRYTKLGRSGPVVSAVGLGSLALAGAYGGIGTAEADRLIRRALDSGVTLLDTADFYAGGRIERLIGRAVAGRDGQVLVSTRGGPAQAGDGPDRLARLVRACEASLGRLGRDHVDLYYLRCGDGVQVETGTARLAELVRAGKIRYLGLSGGTPEQIRRAHAIHEITAVAVECSLQTGPPDAELLRTVRELGIALVAARPLGRGLLTGRIKCPAAFEEGDWRRADPRFGREGRELGAAPLRAVESAASRLDLSAGRLALAWLMAQDGPVVPVPSTRSPVHLEMNLAATRVDLPPEVRDELAGLFPAAYGPSASDLL
ncbi:aldo/keto reductase [Microbispora sp. RL4-1S]|uniref:Aldo/keto reductase n=1 Tax=Microbispora oryzae TaxID=2806554 RepID=A0A940WN18_9ACTN|nr:aldo/keto reductase [Microbispora oryzae]MBP2707903.1 aldo/keto reductase [Microbispora oryzae]